jgi:hypothetical protein
MTSWISVCLPSFVLLLSITSISVIRLVHHYYFDHGHLAYPLHMSRRWRCYRPGLDSVYPSILS